MSFTSKNLKFGVVGFCCLLSWQIQAAPAETNSTNQSPQDNNNGMVGPFQFSIVDSSVFGPIFGAHWTNYLTQDNAFGFELDFGGDEFRLGGTLTHHINERQRFKLTAEHLAQQFEFNFLPGQKVQWAGQNDFGGIYQYLWPDSSWLKNFSLGGYYTAAETETINYAALYVTPQGNFTNIQRFSGAKSESAFAGFTIQPWTGARIEADVNYADANYDTKYQPAKDSSGPGGTLGLEQVLTNHFKIDLAGSHYAPYNLYSAAAAYLFNTRPGTRLELNLTGSHLNGDIYNGTDNRAILGLAYSWGGDPCGARASYADESPDDFLLWTTKPAVYMPAVLVQNDQAVTAIHP